jgi:peptidoglycan LD-endopeptidase LytH
MRNLLIFVFTLTLTLFLMFGCSREIVEEIYVPTETHSEYSSSLDLLGLTETVMGSAWVEAARRAMREPTDVEPPLEEVFFVDPQIPDAVGYRFPLRRGRRVTVEIETELDRYFADLYRVPESNNGGDGESEPILVASRPEDHNTIELETRRDSYYLLRIQPELLRGGRFRVRIIADASLSFPVEGAGPDGILSFYGDRRSGGARVHEGIDIFAPRGTPLLAATDSVVYRVGRRDRGGNIVTLYDRDRDLLLYYAHLEEQLVREGQEVAAGEVIGTVGNTGNAIYTPPHLHIGVYLGHWRSPVDPWDFFVSPATTDPRPANRDDRLGTWMRVARDTVAERAVPGLPVRPRYVNRNPFLLGGGPATINEIGLRDIAPPERFRTTLVAGTAVEVVGATSDNLRVRTTDGATWFVDGNALVEPDSSAYVQQTIPEGTVVRDIPTGDAIAETTDVGPTRIVGYATVRGSSTVPSEHGRPLVVQLGNGRAGLIEVQRYDS